MESLGQAAFSASERSVAIVTTRHGAASWPSQCLLHWRSAPSVQHLRDLAVRLGGLFFLVMTLGFFSGALGSFTELDIDDWRLSRDHWNPRPYGVLDSDVHFYYVVLGVFVVVAFLMLRLVNSPFGLSLEGFARANRG